MGCFLACFGLKKNKKRRKPCKKRRPSGQQDHRSYVPLHSHVSNNFDIHENSTSDSNDQLREKAKEKLRKKVSFNLNVMAYEPIPHDEEDDDDDLSKCLYEGAKWEFNKEEENVIASSHRYKNCRDSYDEEDNEFDFEEIEDSYDDDNDDDELIVDVYSSIEEDVINYNQTGVKRLEPDSNVRDRRQYVLSVLNPVENISQWRQVKAKTSAIPPLKMCEKENIN